VNAPEAPGTKSSSSLRGPRLWLTLIAAALAIAFIVVNTDEVRINFILFKVTAPLLVALLVAMLLGFIIGIVLPRLRSRD